jgi:hypothetical protein
MERTRTIWSSDIGDIEDWREGYEEFCEFNGFTVRQDERFIYEWAVDTNWSYLDDETVNLDKMIEQEIVCISLIERWNGVEIAVNFMGNNLSNILTVLRSGSGEYYGDDKDINCVEYHHDGVNLHLFRKLKSWATSEDIRDLVEHISDARVVERYTDSIYDDVAEIYGWN